ncbi:hypothetical protein [Phreatobacter sp.]|uniref:hypothetical protein n=1 Tax=Phreatobacter sp. TaxID=1966341 RepID=UPI0025F3C723|nr:hypothetical protein [Phreatobacter sp.]
MAARSGGDKAAAKTTPAPAPRTAVLVFHGIGDQRPMETLLGVVDAVLGKPETDRAAARRKGAIPRWIKPYVGKDGSFDLKSVTTPALGLTEKRRYDFFELYWAHLMSGTRFVAVLLWLCDLAKRDRSSLPADARWIWFAAVTLLTAALLAAVHLLWVVGTGLIGLSWRDVAARAGLAAPQATVSFLVLAVLVGGFATFGLRKGWATGLGVAGIFLVFAALAAWHPLALLTLVPALASLVMFLGPVATAYGVAGTAGLSLVVALWGPVWAFVGIGQAGWPEGARLLDIALLTLGHPPTTLWLLVFLTLFVFLAWVFLVPYVGDCARYLRDAPDNIEARNRIRKLGLQVLQDLHDQRNGDGAPRYDRIVVVAHSLGTVIAYDVLRAFFVEQMASARLTDRVIAAFAAIDGLPADAIGEGTYAVAAVDGGLAWQRIGPGGTPSADAYQATVRQAFATFTAEQVSVAKGQIVASPWRISDFVTMGSPLAHAALLMTEAGTNKALDEKVSLREFPVAPPALSPGEDGRVLFAPKTQNPGMPPERPRLQHSAMFALTCWTNLYFAQRAGVKGDFIGGPIPPEHSPGTMNVPLETAISGGYFNHIHYWTAEAPSGDGTAHLRALKLAVLGVDACREVNRTRRILAAGETLAL